ncbi:hypothetical protein [uncultured Mucilaginibacter sp.]|uniref:hypothetical protein n=1 Tax=uncultured Mucilaginibacter sp. TaxID=797541 RepID=UPI0025F49ED1|nr:hypothetical protein [uncultured Mucilaginibacter sp.]
MELSENNAIALLLDLNEDIEEYADCAVKNVIVDKNFEYLNYPPNCGFSDLEKEELHKLDNNPHLKNALRKIIADSSAGVIFNMLNLLDGTGSPKKMYKEWTGVQLVNEEPENDSESFAGTLHDYLFETYWTWKKIRDDKDWKLDTLEEN